MQNVRQEKTKEKGKRGKVVVIYQLRSVRDLARNKWKNANNAIAILSNIPYHTLNKYIHQQPN